MRLKIGFVSSLSACLLLSACGKPQINQSRVTIVNGLDTAAPSHFVSLFGGATSTDPWCGATYIGKGTIMTAGHCVHNAGKALFVTFGFSDPKGFKNATRIKVRSVRLHENYEPKTLLNDIALIFVSEADMARAGIKAQPAPLAQIENNVVPGESVRVIGLGNTSSFGWMDALTLQAVDIPVLAVDSCKKSYPDIGSTQICAGPMAGGLDSCHGDSGGPLFKLDPVKGLILAGLVSYGEGCAQPDFPGIYTQVASYTEWVKKSIARETLVDALPLSERIADVLTTQCYEGFRTSKATKGKEGEWTHGRNFILAGTFATEKVPALSPLIAVGNHCGTNAGMGFDLVQSADAANDDAQFRATLAATRFFAPTKQLHELAGFCNLTETDAAGNPESWTLFASEDYDYVSTGFLGAQWHGEMSASEEAKNSEPGKAWLEARRCSSEGVTLVLELEKDQAGVESGRGRFRVTGENSPYAGKTFLLKKRKKSAKPEVEAKLIAQGDKNLTLELTNQSDTVIYGIELACDKAFNIRDAQGKPHAPSERDGTFVHRFTGLNNEMALLPAERGTRAYKIEWADVVPTKANPLTCTLNNEVEFSVF